MYAVINWSLNLRARNHQKAKKLVDRFAGMIYRHVTITKIEPRHYDGGAFCEVYATSSLCEVDSLGEALLAALHRLRDVDIRWSVTPMLIDGDLDDEFASYVCGQSFGKPTIAGIEHVEFEIRLSKEDPANTERNAVLDEIAALGQEIDADILAAEDARKDVSEHGAIPWEELKCALSHEPNAETIKVIEEVREGKNLLRYETTEAMFKDLGI
jgi:hypothetical protein